MPSRSLAAIDGELSEAVKARAAAKLAIKQQSDAVIYNTKKIDELLAERSSCPDTLADLLARPLVTPSSLAKKKPTPDATRPAS